MEGSEDGCLLTSEAVFRAAALCPLYGGSRRVWFDVDDFFSIERHQRVVRKDTPDSSGRVIITARLVIGAIATSPCTSTRDSVFFL